MTLEEQAERQHGIVAAHIAAENAHDWNAASAGFTQTGTAFRDTLLVATAFKGVGGVRAFYDTIGKALPDMHIEIKSQHDLPGCTALTWNPFCNPFVFTFMHGMRGVPPFFTKKEEELISTLFFANPDRWHPSKTAESWKQMFPPTVLTVRRG